MASLETQHQQQQLQQQEEAMYLITARLAIKHSHDSSAGRCTWTSIGASSRTRVTNAARASPVTSTSRATSSSTRTAASSSAPPVARSSSTNAAWTPTSRSARASAKPASCTKKLCEKRDTVWSCETKNLAVLSLYLFSHAWVGLQIRKIAIISLGTAFWCCVFFEQLIIVNNLKERNRPAGIAYRSSLACEESSCFAVGLCRLENSHQAGQIVQSF